MKTALPLLAPSDEVWVITKPPKDHAAAPAGDTPGTGTLLCLAPDQHLIPLPLQHTDVRAGILGYIATVDVMQRFANPYDAKIEAVYVFPLPEDAAVSDFIMQIGERQIRGIIREREEAEKIYREARAQGHVASLLTQERPNIFTQKVANIEPGKRIDVKITYFSTLEYADGWYEFVFPMVVGPRFDPPGSTTGVGAVGRGAQGVSGQATEVPYLRPSERSGHDIALSVELNAGVPIEAIECNSHRITTSRAGDGRATVTLASDDTVPNKDFVLRYRVAGERVKSSLIAQQDVRGASGGYFTLMLFPPAELTSLRRQPMEMIFVLDCSGSMDGFPIEKAKGALEHALSRMLPDDTFQIVQFSNRASAFGPRPVPATPENLAQAIRYVRELQGEGGTMMTEGIKAALDFPHDENRLRFVAFMTDGFIGNENEILAQVHEKLGPTRVFSFGVGSSPNRYLLDGLAKLGRGAVAYVGPHDDSRAIMDTFFERVCHPALTDVQVHWGGTRVEDVFPRRTPDLFVGRPVVLTGRFRGEAPRHVRVTGKAGNEPVEMTVTLERSDAAEHRGLPAVWARMQIDDLSARMLQGGGDHGDRIKQLALDYNLVSAYTAFVAVDGRMRTAGAYGTTVPVPVPVPEGTRYETTVTE